MMTELDDAADVRAALRAATGHLAPPSGLLADVRRGGQRRRRRRRMTAVAGVAVALTAALVAPAMWNRPAGPPRPAATWSASDASYVDAVIRAWNASHATSANATRGIFDDLRGRPKVLWAGDTPAGRAAIVTQQAYLHPHADLSSDDANQLRELFGFVADVDGRPTVVDDDYAARGVPPMRGFFAGADRSVLIVLDSGTPMAWSLRTYQPDGTITRDWHQLTFTRGAAVAQVPPGADQRSLVVTREPGHAVDSMVLLGNASAREGRDTDRQLPWNAVYRLTGPDTPLPVDSLDAHCPLMRTGEALASDGYEWRGGGARWCAFGTTPDGRAVTVGDLQLDNDASYLYYTLGSGPTMRRGNAGPVDPTKPLPVLAKLPDGQGWIVARKGAVLSYRVGTGPLQGARRNAALLPPDATRVLVDTGADPKVDVPLNLCC
jgi:hypothetical protein